MRLISDEAPIEPTKAFRVLAMKLRDCCRRRASPSGGNSRKEVTEGRGPGGGASALPVAANHLLIDGNRLPRDLPCPAEAIVGGDARCLSIAAASIIAKVERDRIMVDLAQQHPGYGWETNAGYPTPEHLQALLDLGVTPWHRRSFRPVHNILYQDVSVTS